MDTGVSPERVHRKKVSLHRGFMGTVFSPQSVKWVQVSVH